MSVWVCVCVLVRVGVCVNTERDVLGVSGCSSTYCSAGVVAASTVWAFASHVVFLGGRGTWFATLGMSVSVRCSVLATDGAVMHVVGNVT